MNTTEKIKQLKDFIPSHFEVDECTETKKDNFFVRIKHKFSSDAKFGKFSEIEMNLQGDELPKIDKREKSNILNFTF